MLARLRIVVLLLLVAIASACTKPEPPTITTESATVTAVTANGMTIRAVFDVHNPNDFGLTVHNVTATITMGDIVKMGPVDVGSTVRLPANKSTKVSVDVPATWENAAQVAALAAASPTIPFVMKGKAKIGGKKLNVEVPFTIRGTVTRQQLLQAGLKGLPALPDIFGR